MRVGVTVRLGVLVLDGLRVGVPDLLREGVPDRVEVILRVWLGVIVLDAVFEGVAERVGVLDGVWVLLGLLFDLHKSHVLFDHFLTI